MARRYSDAERAEALELYATHGLAHAARETGVSKGSIRNWAAEKGVTTARADEKAAEATAERMRQWQERRGEVLAKMGELADRATTMAIGLTSLDPSLAKDAATTAGIAIDKAQLLAGEATQRTEAVTVERTPEAEGRLGELIDLEKHRRAA